MEYSITQIEHMPDNIIKESDIGLDDQSFFNAHKDLKANHKTIPASFIMDRMTRVN